MGAAPANILIVEDDPSSAFILEKILERAGHHALPIAKTGEEALERVNQIPPDLILMDVSMPGSLDGVETAARIREHHDIPIIYLTGYSDEQTIDRAKRTAPFAYILKPFREKEVVITIRMALYKAQVDQQVKSSEQRLAVTLGSLHDGVISTDQYGRITYMNPAAELFTGHLIDDVLNHPIDEVLKLHRKPGRERIRNVQDFIFGESFPHYGDPVLLYTPEQDSRIVQIRTSASRQADGEPESWVILLRDISDRYYAEQQNRLMASALTNLQDAVIITEAETGTSPPAILYTNEAFERITGYSRTHVQDKTLDILYGKKTDNKSLQQCQKSLADGHPFEGENQFYCEDGSEFLGQITVTPVHGEDGEISNFVYAIRDITELRGLEDSLRQSQKIEAIGRLAGGIAHDFNNLLSVINSYSDLLNLKIDEESPLRKYITNIRTAGQRGAALVSQLMTFSRRESAQPVLLDLAELTMETRKMLMPLIRENIKLTANLNDGLWSVKADPGQFEQILVNLCVNARDAMPEGGQIEILGENVEVPEQQPGSHDYMIPGKYVLISVRDTGCGMDSEVLKHLFEPFFTTKDIGKGTGLGLSTVYGIVKQCGGYINVESKPGQGTTFKLHFPAASAEKAEVKPEEPESKNVPRGSENILIVEDDETFADCISGLLSLHGYIVHVAGEGLEAIESYGNRAEDIKLLVTDIVLPKISGREVANRFLELNPNMKVIFMTGYDDEVDTFYSFPDDATVLRKPFSLTTILSKVRELLDNAEDAPAKEVSS